VTDAALERTERSVDPHRTRAVRAFVVLGVALCVSFFLAAGIGAVGISPEKIFAMLLHRVGIGDASGFAPQEAAVFFSIRLPRVLLATLVGAGLASSGAVLQGLFRNPLADPALIGISSGATLSVSTAIVFGAPVLAALPDSLRAFALPATAFAGSWVAAIAVWRFGTRTGRTDVATMLLAGIAVNAMAFAGTGMLTLAADEPELRDLTFWTLGSLNGATWSKFPVVAPAIAIALVGFPALSRSLNAFLLGEAEARHLGVSVERVKRLAIVLSALAVGAAVSISGTIGFVGLVAPHLVRLVLGADHRRLLPASALLGSVLVILSDLLARTVLVPAEVPLGVVTALVGAPFFLWLVSRNARRSGVPT
jgi:iron complex transport system permease protein